MSRSRVLAVSAAALLLTIAARATTSSAEENRVLSPIGMLDCAHGPSTVKVGSWVKYHVTGKSDLGVIEDYYVTMLIAGEEDLWGEECFWVETWTTGSKKLAASRVAVLMSYSAFDDSLAMSNVNIYRRKLISGFTEDNKPFERLVLRGETALTKRTSGPEGLRRKLDTLGTDTARTVKGDFVCLKIRSERGIMGTAQSADSSKYEESREVRVTYRTPEIPITGIAHEDLDVGVRFRTWLTGQSGDAGPLLVKDQSKGAVDLVDFGTGGLEAVMVPADRRHTLAEQRAAQAARDEVARPKATPAVGKPRTATRPGTPPR